jgi:prolyl-tRNA synthetase
MLEIYADFAVKDAAIPVVKGAKTESEKFAGALRSYTVEAMMGDTRALQSGTSHNLGQNFAKAFEIQYLDRNNELQHCWTTSWGLSTRMIGAIIMTHGDDQGLILPPRLAPHQVVVVPIWKTDAERAAVAGAVGPVMAALAGAGVRAKLDDRDGITPGFKFNDWEMRGVPLRIEIGPRDAAKGVVTLARRDVLGREGKSAVPQEGLAETVVRMLADIQTALYDRALAFRRANTHEPTSYEDFKVVVEDGWADVWWAGDREDEARVKEETRATIRCIPLEQPGGTGPCFYTGRPATERVIFARAY